MGFPIVSSGMALAGCESEHTGRAALGGVPHRQLWPGVGVERYRIGYARWGFQSSVPACRRRGASAGISVGLRAVWFAIVRSGLPWC